MRFDPKTDDELNPVLPSGEYDAEVVKSEETVSKKGHDMIALVLKVFSGDMHVFVRDWLLPAQLPGGAKKFKNFCKAAQLMELYDAGEVTADDLHGTSVRVKLGVQTSESYGDQNTVAGYPVDTEFSQAVRPEIEKRKVNNKARQTNAVDSTGAAIPDDDIPFSFMWWLVPLGLTAMSSGLVS